MAETIDIETDPQMRRLTAAHDALAESEAEAPALDAAGEAAPAEAPRRVLLALHYTAPADLARAAIARPSPSSTSRTASSSGSRRPTTAGGPRSTGSRSPRRSPSSSRASSSAAPTRPPCGCASPGPRPPTGPSGQLAPAARIDIAYPAVITERDLGTDPGASPRRSLRKMDLGTAEKLLEANGGRLIRPVAGEPTLSVLLRASH